MSRGESEALSKGRKLRLAYLSIALIAVGFLATGLWGPLATTYGEFIMGLLAAASIYSGGNVAAKWLYLRNGGSAEAEPAKKAPKKGPPVEPSGD